MDSFQYKAIDTSGMVHNGSVDATNVADLEMRLKKMGLDLINYKEVKSGGGISTGKGIKRRDLITYCFHLEQTTRAGVPIIDSLQDLRDSTDNPRMTEVLSSMVELIEGGSTLAAAMKEFPGVFSKVFSSLVEAGEQTGEMSVVFKELGDNLKWQDEQAAHTKKLIMYPAFVGVVVMFVVFFLMTYLVPELLKFINTMGQELPPHTKVLIFVSDLFVNYWYIILSLPIVLAVGITVGIKTSPNFHYKMDALKLKIPVIGPILKKIILTRLSSFFAMMYASGITIIECIRTGEDIAGNMVIARAMRQVGQNIADGATLSSSFESSDLFPPLVLRMLRVGENTGSLEDSLHNISYFYSRDVRESIDRLQSLIEPAMTIILGAIVAWVMFSVLGPIYDLITKIKI